MYEPIKWPETCYIQEAVYWVALGRAPEFIVYPGEWGDARLGKEAMRSGEIAQFDTGYSETEFRWAGVSVLDMDRYIRAPQGLDTSRSAENSGAEYVAYWDEKLKSIFDSNSDEDKQEYLQRMETVRSDAADFEWRRDLESAFAPHVESARLSVLQALIKGDLSAFGLLQYNDDQGYIYHRRVDIASTRWRLTFDWRESELREGADVFYAVQVNTADLLRVFPRPLCEPTIDIRVDLYPSAALLTDKAEYQLTSNVVTRRQGRPKLADGLIEQAAYRWAADRMKRGVAPKKRDALVQEAIEFARDILGHKVTRTTMQRWLKGLPRAET
ncbi:MAG: hypothetical protein QE284_17260 [Rhizobium sp.]|nr:hypothetical protein [Rhizobium sp.]